MLLSTLTPISFICSSTAPLSVGPPRTGALALTVPPTLRFHGGPLPAQSGIYERRVKLENTGPFDLKLRWRVYDETAPLALAAPPAAPKREAVSFSASTVDPLSDEPAPLASADGEVAPAVASADATQSDPTSPQVASSSSSPSAAESAVAPPPQLPPSLPAAPAPPAKDVIRLSLGLAPPSGNTDSPALLLQIEPLEAEADFAVRVPHPEVIIKARSHTHMSVHFCAEAPGVARAYLRAETMIRAGDREKVQAPSASDAQTDVMEGASFVECMFRGARGACLVAARVFRHWLDHCRRSHAGS